jgi:uncharacterized damage-inducible protein DinB
MKKLYLILAGFLVVALTTAAAAQASKPKSKEVQHTVTQVLNNTVSNLEHDLVPAAEAMPEDKFGFAPSEGEFKNVRTFAQQIKHIAAVNYELGAAILQQKPPTDLNDEAGPGSITNKVDIVKYLRDSFEYVHKAIDTINDKNLVETVKSPFGEGKVTRLSLATSVAWHGFDHYGQMVVYLRMNGIIPPASR